MFFKFDVSLIGRTLISIIFHNLQLAKSAAKGTVSIGLDDRREEVYVPPPPPAYVAFGGAGATLGGGSNSTAGSAIFTSAQVASAGPVLDAAEPSTTIQVKMHDGKKLRIK